MAKLAINGTDISDFVESITWSGDIQQCYRTLTAKLARGIQPECGDHVVLCCDGAAVFSGYIVEAGRDPYGTTLEAHDVGMYLTRNYMYREYSGTPQAIARAVCQELDIQLGRLAEKSTNTKVTSTGNMTAAKVIEEAYEGKHSRTRKYICFIQNGKLHIQKIGAEFAGEISGEIETASRKWSTKNMVNRVVILNKKNRKSGDVENAGDRKKYGTYQKTYRHQEKKNDATEAGKLLTRLEQQGSIRTLGRMECVAGKRIRVTEKRTGLSGEQIIKSDKHTITAAGHEMSLELYYEAK